MLDKFRILLALHGQAARRSLHNLCQKPLATSMTIIVIAITLCLPALFWVFTQNIENLTASWKKNGHITLYLQPMNEEQVNSLVSELRQIQGIGDLSTKSASDGLAELQQQEGMQNIMQFLPDNPLPTVIEITPSAEANAPSQIEALFQRLQQLPEIEQAKLDLEWINRLHAFLNFMNKLATGFIVLLALAVILVIGNTLRLAIQNRQEEIQVLKLIGAADPYISRPFLYSGLWYGLAGGIFAILLINIFMLSVAIAVDQIAKEYQMHYPLLGLSFKQGFVLIISSLFLGWLGAKMSVKRQLASIEPYK
jgi:cell division transport system permease protein